MNLKNTYKSRIFEKKLPKDLFYASIDNFTEQTDTISKVVHTRYVQFYFCLRGSVNFHFSESYSKILEQSNSFLIYQPNKDLPLQISVSARSRLDILVISISDLHHLFSSELFEDVFADSQTRVYEQGLISIESRNVLQSLERIQTDSKLGDLLWRNKLNELILLHFVQKINLENSCPFLENQQEAQRIQQAKDYLLSDVKQAKTTQQIADSVGLSEYKLKEGFKKLYGMSTTQYLLHYKLQKGKSEIEKRNRKIKEIAADLGYDNPSHFIEVFKKIYGITPKQYEKSLH